MQASEPRSVSLLYEMTGLSDKDLADVLQKNPRAYMNLRGAVAEKHLEILLEKYREDGGIKSFRRGRGDFEKDFYIVLQNDVDIAIECKNVQVYNPNKSEFRIKYLKFLLGHNYLDQNQWRDLITKTNTELHCALDVSAADRCLDGGPKKIIDHIEALLPQDLRESGLPRYKFSESMLQIRHVDRNKLKPFLTQFDEHPLTIDFQRTRNSTDALDGNPKAQRFYKVGEIDIVAACLFARTASWEFIFTSSTHLERHRYFNDRYTNRLMIKPDCWVATLTEALLLD
ncbi:MAG: hypothetical protein V2A66_07685 [Pseudomonadota bacterium]